MSKQPNYREFTELPAWTRAVWKGEKVVNESDPFKWSGDADPPAIGTKVKVYMNSFGNGVVVGYFVEYDWMGVLVAISKPPKWWVQQCKNRGENPKATPGHFFGVDLQPRKATVEA